MSDDIDLVLVVGQLLGGLSLFLYGMEKMSHGAHMHCTDRRFLRTILQTGSPAHDMAPVRTLMALSRRAVAA